MKRVTLYLIILIVLLYVLDQVSKWYIVFHYNLPTPYYLDHTPVITGSSMKTILWAKFTMPLRWWTTLFCLS